VKYIIDLDGTIYRGDTPIQYAREFIDYLNSGGRDYLLVTNCPSNTQASLVEKLRGMDINVKESNILTSGQATASFLVKHGLSRVYLVGGKALETELKKKGIELVENDAKCVVVGYDLGFTYEKMRRAGKEIRNGAEFVCTNGDHVIPYRDTMVPHTGAIAASIQAASGVKPVIIGKPEKHMLDEALDILGCTKDECCVIGDNIDTDIAFGKRHGVASFLVMTGVTTQAELERSSIKPDMVFANLLEVIEHDVSRGRFF